MGCAFGRTPFVLVREFTHIDPGSLVFVGEIVALRVLDTRA
jgi:hypothetical protein